MERMANVRAAGAREWSDDVEAVSGMLGAADVLDRATGARRQLARSIVRAGWSPSDVLTWLVHWIGRGKGAGWLCVVLRRDPAAIGKCLCKRRGVGGAVPQLAGHVDVERQRQVHELVAVAAARSAAPATRDTADHAARAVAAGDVETAVRLAWLLPQHERAAVAEQLQAKMAPSRRSLRPRLRLLA